MTAGIVPMFLQVHSRDIAMVKFVFESYEGVAIVRTLDRRQAIIVVLAAVDFVSDARAIIASLQQQIVCVEVPPPSSAGDDWLLAAMEESDQ
jgi:hypothetical protein